MKRLSIALLAVSLLSLFALVAITKADTLTLTINGAQFNDGSFFVGPYQSTIAYDNTDHTAGYFFQQITFCIDFESHVGFGQAFTIQTYNLADYAGPLKTEYWEAGWIFLQMASVTDTATLSVMQRAAWLITGAHPSSYLNGPSVEGWIHAAQDNYQTVSASTFTLYLKDGDVGQSQLGINSVPEPTTAAMALIGIAALVAIRRWAWNCG